jgi:urea carboxylase
MFRKILIANRGAIACRIIRTLRRMGIGSVAVYSEADRHSLHVLQADEAVAIGPASPLQSYLNVEALLQAARATGAEAIHPGYGFLSENAAFAEACADRGIVFIGPTPHQMREFGLKHTARKVAAENGLPMLPGTGLLASIDEAFEAADRIGYPLMLKSTAGGGGIGMRLCSNRSELADAYIAVERLSSASFGSGGMYLEKFVTQARHIEVQIFGDGAGTVIALGERDCSTQRRHQKVIEETPAPNLPPAVRAAMLDSAVRLGEAVSYQSAGTVEFIYDNTSGEFYFLEVNTRLQVEHGVTEEVTGIDLVEWMVLQSAGELPDLRTVNVAPKGASIQVRLYAEDPGNHFQPSSGRLTNVQFPNNVAHAVKPVDSRVLDSHVAQAVDPAELGVLDSNVARAVKPAESRVISTLETRVETWIESGTEVTPYYDPMLAKLIVRADDRAAALASLHTALAACRLDGIETNLEYLRQVTASPEFAAGGVTTSFLRDFDYHRRAVDVLSPGTQTTVQDFPGRLGYWHVGVPPSGPMDSLAFRIANRLVGNLDDAAGLEITVTGPTLRFRCDATIALTGADFGARLDDAPAPLWKPIAVRAGATLELDTVRGGGSRAYLAIAGGFDAPKYLGSASTFILGKFGGFAGRALRTGDVLAIRPISAPTIATPPATPPPYTNQWEIGVLYGPHGAPDFFTPADIETFFSTQWKVHHNSDRTGIRLIGPKMQWARKDGGEAGLHPSNIHDNAYAIGSIDFTGDMPVILGPDGPSLGGFVCPAVIVDAELWKMGQLRPGDLVQFVVQAFPPAQIRAEFPSPILRSKPSAAMSAICRAAGDRYLLLEYGPNILDLNLRFRVHALETQLRALDLAGIVDITPGVRSLQIHYDSKLSRDALLDALDLCETRIPDLDDLVVPSRIVHLPLSWDDPATQLAIAKYTQSVRPDAPWVSNEKPSNIEFIRRINGLSSIDEVQQIVFAANYLVLGLGDVYLGAPVATPTDPRHRLVTTKYNPARTWTPENAVGIGGAYMCVYGMEGPGGYQFVGRTVQMWNTYRSTPAFEPGTPWLLRFFDQIRFTSVSANELLEIREGFLFGEYPLKIEHADFRLKEYHAFLESTADQSAKFKQTQQLAFEEERERWAAAGADKLFEPPDLDFETNPIDSVPEGCRAVCSPVTANVWEISVDVGQRVEAGQRLIVLEAMKMEIAVSSPCAGIVEKLLCAKGSLVTAGQSLLLLRMSA